MIARPQSDLASGFYIDPALSLHQPSQPASQSSHEENKYIYNETSVQPNTAQHSDFSSPSQPGRIVSSELIKV